MVIEPKPESRGILCNLTYTGILRCGNSRSERLSQLQIISQELHDQAQEIRTARANQAENTFVPQNTRGQSLLVGNIYCAHCGSRLCLTTNTKKNAKGEKVIRVRYICYGKTRKQTECDGQTGYLIYKVDDAVDKLVRKIFSRMQGFSRKEVIQGRYQQKLSEQRALVQVAQADYTRAEKELSDLKAEVIKSIQGNSAFPTDLLAGMVEQSEEKCKLLLMHLTEAENTYQQGAATLHQLECQFDHVLSMAEMYDRASMEAKKMIVSRMISRVEVGRDYNIHVQLRPEFKEFFAVASKAVEKTA